jgi:hypothetical protein
MKKSLSLVLALAMVFTMFASVAFAADAPATTTAAPAVTETVYTPQTAFDALKAAGIVEGDAVKGANLDGNLTRAETSKVIAKLWELAEYPEGSNVYTDLIGATWAKGYIGAATKAGILNGMGGGKFNPSGNVKLEEIAKIIAVGLGLKSVPYTGAGKVDAWANGYVGALVAAKIIPDAADFTRPAVRGEIFVVGIKGYTMIQLAKIPTPTPTPAVTAKALDLSSAAAINSKVVEVTLATAAAAADLTAANVTVKTGTTALAVSSVVAAPYSTDGLTVLVTLAADTAVGTLYTLTSGTKSVNFGGQPVDVTAPTVSTTIAVNDYNEIEITFSEPVQIPGAVITAAQSYGTKTALATSGFAYGASKYSIKVTTAAQLAATLYSLSISGVKDFAGNTMVADAAQTFVGIAMPSDANTITGIKAYDSKTVKVSYALKVDATTSLDKAKYAVAETYGAKAAIAVTGVALDDVDPTHTVVLTLASDTVASLYTVTIAAGVTTKYGVATTAALSGTFVGEIADVVALSTPAAVSTNNKTVTLTFGTSAVADGVLAATTKDQFAITEAYGTKAALAVTGISISGNVVTLTTGPQNGVLYNVVVKSGIKDLKGNATTADLTTTIVGSLVAAAITSITNAVLDAAGTTLTVDFNQNVGATATDIAHYTINNSIGYPSKAVKVDDNTVKLSVPATSNKLYILTVKGLENADGVAMDAAGITRSFTGKGISSTLPAIQAVIASDTQTLNIYFDRDVTDSSILGAGKIWNGNSLVAGSLALKTASGVYGGSKDLDTYVEYVHQDATNLNVLVVRIGTSDFSAANKRADGTLAIVAANGLLATNAVVTPFSPSATAISAISVQNIMSTSSNSIRVYFNQPVEVSNTAGTNTFATVEASAGAAYGTGRTLSNGVAIDSTKTIWDFKISTPFTTATSFWLVGLPTGTIGAIHDYTADTNAGYVTLTDSDAVASNNIQSVTQFASSTTASTNITEVSVLMTDTKTMVVYYPEAMKITGGDNTDVLFKNNYTVINGLNAPILPSANIISTTWDATNNTVTLKLNAPITSTSGYYLTLPITLSNAIGNKTVQNAGVAVTKQFANGTVAAAKVTVTSATYAAATGKVTINLNQAITNGASIDETNLSTFLALTINGGTAVANTTDVLSVDATSTPGVVVVTLKPTVVVTSGGVGTVTATALLAGVNAEPGDAASSTSFSQ